MTRSSGQLLLVLAITALAVGLVTPSQPGRWVQTGAGWVVEVARTISS